MCEENNTDHSSHKWQNRCFFTSSNNNNTEDWMMKAVQPVTPVVDRFICDYNTTNSSNVSLTDCHSSIPRIELTVLDFIIAIFLSAFIICIIIGNILVVSSVLLFRDMRTLTNALIVSLAIADLLVAIIVLPISLHFEIMDHVWTIGPIVCDFWITSDVFCCTASILNIVVIAMDRYWLITMNVRYTHNAKFPRKRVCAVMISLAWVLSVVISLYPLLGLSSGHVKGEGQCFISQDLGYTLFSTFGAFWFPLSVILITYFKIFKIARKRERRREKSRSICPSITTIGTDANSSFKGPKYSVDYNSSIKGLHHQNSKHSVDYSRKNSVAKEWNKDTIKDSNSSKNDECNLEENNSHVKEKTVSGFNECKLAEKGPLEQIKEDDNDDDNNKEDFVVNKIDNLITDNGVNLENIKDCKPLPLNEAGSCHPLGRGIHKTQRGGIQTHTEKMSNNSVTSVMNDSNPLNNNGGCDLKNTFQKQSSHDNHDCRYSQRNDNNNINDKPLLIKQTSIEGIPTPQRYSLQKLSSTEEAEDEEVMNSIKYKSKRGSSLQGSGYFRSKTRRQFQRLAQCRSSRMRYRNRIRSSARTLGLIIGCFVMCWMPFFILATINPFCIVCRDKVPGFVSSLGLWLGYSNSLLNPAIYAIWDKNFRRSFKKVIKCQINWSYIL